MKFDFPNSNGEILSGSLELPEGEPIAYAIFAHCFTCSKDIIAPHTIAKMLTQIGIAVLRFDFTGLGMSQGNFSNTNFTSNIGDLLCAYEHLEKKYEAPKLLIGHSLGGAAVLKAVTKLPKIKAAVTIGAPSSIQHIKRLLGNNDISNIEQEGQAEVNLAGRKFTIKKQFLEDLGKTSILEGLTQIETSLLVLHSPSDDTVPIDHASVIFSSANHPKSFISLDNADHLLMNKNDAIYAANLIGSWALRYIC